jgi:hypothetical protein
MGHMNKYEITLIGRDSFKLEADIITWTDNGCVVLYAKNDENDEHDVVAVFPIHSLVGIVKLENNDG